MSKFFVKWLFLKDLFFIEIDVDGIDYFNIFNGLIIYLIRLDESFKDDDKAIIILVLFRDILKYNLLLRVF